MLEEGALARDGRYRTIVVRVIELSRAGVTGRLGAASKLNRDPAFIDALMAHGEARAREFLAALAFERAWLAGDVDATASFFASDARLCSQAPFPVRGPVQGLDAIRRFLRTHVGARITIDVTRKQLAGDSVTWSARWQRRPSAPSSRGEIEARFRGDRVVDLTLSGAR